jgi:hypothetical protein
VRGEGKQKGKTNKQVKIKTTKQSKNTSVEEINRER